jgi:queuine/archaeosine tRNA-ribosyltransferase|tara:strand:- start:1152 stop:1406 length:255 start_codon:yes stop_codon:yes gene_type:complete
MPGKRIKKSNLESALEILAQKLDSKEYSKITGVMSMLFIGHQFDLSGDGFEFINLAIKIKKESHKKTFKKALHGNVIRLKPKSS